MGLTHDVHNDGGHPDVSPRSAAVVLNPTETTDGTPETSAPHAANSGPDSRPEPAVTSAHCEELQDLPSRQFGKRR